MSLFSLSTSSVVEEAKLPVAVISAEPAYGVLGSVIKLNGQASNDPTDLPLTFTWSFSEIPIGSMVTQESFRVLDDTGSLVSFSPDIVGEYKVSLTVSNGVFDSLPDATLVSIRAILVPHGRGHIPDGKFIWSYIRDAWNGVEGREVFETLWSALIQLTGADLLKLYQNDYNKSIRDIQDKYQRRWLSYEPKLVVSPAECSFFLGNHCAGTDATSASVGLTGQAIILSNGELVVTQGSVLPNVVGQTITILYDSEQPDNLGSYYVLGLNSAKTGYKVAQIDNPNSPPTTIPDLAADKVVVNGSAIFTFQSTAWSFDPAITADLVQVGDVIQFSSGPNSGLYKVTDKVGTDITVNKKPASYSDATSSLVYTVNVYRPVGFRITQPDTSTTDTFAVPYVTGSGDISSISPGRVCVFNGRAYTVVRSLVDTNQSVPLVLITVDDDTVPSGLYGQTWRAPHTLVSDTQDFEALGVSTGDLLVVDVLHVSAQVSSQVSAQVVGVSGNSLGFVLTNEPVTPGEIPDVPNETYLSLASDFNVSQILENKDGSLTFLSDVKALIDTINSKAFQRTYWNTELTVDSDITVKGVKFRVRPRYIVRNRLVPVEDTVLSIPVLQDWVVQPEVVERDGKFYQRTRGKEYEIKSRPVSLVENSDYVVDGQIAYSGDLTFDTGTNIVYSETGHFLNRGMRPGDVLSIITPTALAGDYTIQTVISNDEIKVNSVIPLYVLSESVTAQVQLVRKKDGKFLRFVPGGFTAKNPAPDRLWAEVSFFDNSDAIEDNFGILVGLTKEDLDEVSSGVSYKQAVAGLMYAFTRGSSIDRVRLGAQILLGLPFAENRGIIRSLETDYRLDVDGNPVLGRLLVEDIDINNNPMGTQRVYSYPIDPDSRLAGLEINPATGAEYKVGDTVELFAALSKGVEIADYLTDPLNTNSAIAKLKQFHSVRLRANDSVFSVGELGLVSSFLKKITPSYIAFTVSSVIELGDDVTVDDQSNGRIRLGDDILIDNASFSIPPVMMFGGMSGGAIEYAYWEDGFYWVKKSGTNLETENGSNTFTVSTGGLITPTYGEAPIAKVGDVLKIMSGINEGAYPITTLSDTDGEVSGEPALGFEEVTGQHYAILRPITPLLRTDTADYTNGSDIVSLSEGLQAEGVSPGDWLVVETSTGTYRRHTILRVGGGLVADGLSPALAAGEAQVTPDAPETGTDKVCYIYRPQFFSAPYTTITADLTPVNPAGDNYGALSDKHLQALIDIGDELMVTTGDMRRFVVIDAATLYVVPPIPAGTYEVQLCKKNRESTYVSFNQMDFDPMEQVSISVGDPGLTAATCTSGSREVALSGVNPVTNGIKQGDLLQLLNGGNSTVDVGYGLGVYPIVELTAAVVKVAVALTSNDDSAWKVIRRRP